MTCYEINSLIASWAQAIAGVATLYVAYLAYRRFLVQKLAEGQLALVLELIEAIDKNKLRFAKMDKTIAGGPGSYAQSFDNKSFFDLSVLHPITDSDLRDTPIYTTSEHRLFSPLSPFSFLTNPLLPNKISTALNDLRFSLQPGPVDYTELPKYILLGQKQPRSAIAIVSEDVFQLEGGITQLAEAANKVTLSITNWLMIYGLDDINRSVLLPESKNIFFSPFD